MLRGLYQGWTRLYRANRLILVNYPAGDEETVGIKPGVYMHASGSTGDRSRQAVIRVKDARDVEGEGLEVLFGHVHLHLMLPLYQAHPRLYRPYRLILVKHLEGVTNLQHSRLIVYGLKTVQDLQDPLLDLQ